MNQFLKFHHLSTKYDHLMNEWGSGFVGFAVRGFVAWQFFKAGLVKVNDWSSTLDLFRDEYHVPWINPELAAYMGASGELVLSILLLLGLFSRPAAIGLFFVNLMAVLSYPELWKFECPAAINDHLYWGMLLLVLISYGVGKFSVDDILKNWHSKSL